MKKIIFIFCFAFSLIAFNKANASIISDNFNSYTSGNSLETESGGYWSNDWGGLYTAPNVTNSSTCYSGNCINMTYTGANAYVASVIATSGSPFTGYGSIKFYQQDLAVTEANLYFRFYDSTHTNFISGGLRSSGGVHFDFDGNNISGTITNATSTWHTFYWNYSQTGSKIRFKFDNLSWTGWYTQLWIPTEFTMVAQADTSNNRYVDNFNLSLTENLNQVELEAPANSSIVKDFDFWTINYSASSSASTYELTVQYGRTTSTIDYVDSEIVPYSENLVQWKLPKSNVLSEGDWYAQSFLYEDDNLVAYTSQHGFLVDNTNGTDITYGYNPNATSTVNELNVTCDQSSGFFASSLCNLFNFLIVPSTQKVKSLKDSIDLSQRQPFSNFYIIRNEINSMSSSTTFGNYYLPSSNFDTFFTVIFDMFKLLIWLFFMYYLIKRIRKFKI